MRRQPYRRLAAVVLAGSLVAMPSATGTASRDLPAVAIARLVPGSLWSAPAASPDLDRIAAAVDAIESAHGANPAMWRADPLGPQGPMQVSAAAAADVGGGDRFDLVDNRRLGRAYLAVLFRRYGNWSEALAAYGWGPAHVDAWIGSGRPAAQLPPSVGLYVRRVLQQMVAGGVDAVAPVAVLAGTTPFSPELPRPLRAPLPPAPLLAVGGAKPFGVSKQRFDAWQARLRAIAATLPRDAGPSAF